MEYTITNRQISSIFLSLVKPTFEECISLASKEQAIATSTDQEMRSQHAIHSIDTVHRIICISTFAAWDDGGAVWQGLQLGKEPLFWVGINKSPTPTRVGAKAILLTLKIAKDKGWHSIIISLDA